MTSYAVKAEWTDRMTLPVEDYLHGVINTVNDLVWVFCLPRQTTQLMILVSRGWPSIV